MSQFKKVPEAQFSPTVCAFCGTHEGPFIDTHVSFPVHGHAYICCANDHRSGCIQQMAGLDGMISLEELQRADAEIADLQNRLSDLRDTLAGKATVDLVDLLRMYKIELPLAEGATR